SVEASMRERLGVIASLAPPEPRPRVACIEWTDPMFAAGHWVPEMVTLAGGTDPLGTSGLPSTDVPWERVLESQPEVMVLMPCGLSLDQTLGVAHEVSSRPGFGDLPCARSGRAIGCRGSSFFNGPASRLVAGTLFLATAARLPP